MYLCLVEDASHVTGAWTCVCLAIGEAVEACESEEWEGAGGHQRGGAAGPPADAAFWGPVRSVC